MKRLTRAQVREVDRRAIEELGLPGIVLMENAARAVADQVIAPWEHDAVGLCVTVVCGGGNNGGDGYTVARHLHNRGAEVDIIMGKPVNELSGDAALNARVVAKLGLSIRPYDGQSLGGEVVVDALLGTGLNSPPRTVAAAIIDAINEFRALDWRVVVAVDLPSGLDCNTGRPLGPSCVRATHTVTFVAEKAGFADPASREFTGQVTVGDIGVPPELVEAVRRTT